MDGSRRSADDERWLFPWTFPHALGHIMRIGHAKQPEQRRIGLPEYNGTPTDDAQTGAGSSVINPSFLRLWIHRENAHKCSAPGKMRRGGGAVVANVAAHFEPAGDLLRMIAGNAAARRKIGRAAKNKIKFFLGTEDRGVAKVPVTYFIATVDSIPCCRFSRQADALRLSFDRDKARSRQLPSGDHSHCANATAQIQDGLGSWATGGAKPGG